MILGAPAGKTRASGETEEAREAQEGYPDGTPLSASKDFLSPNGECRRGKREAIKTKGLRPLIRTHLARMGGRKAGKMSPVMDIVGYVQSFRDQLTEAYMKYRRRRIAKPEAKAGCGSIEAFPTTSDFARPLVLG